MVGLFFTERVYPPSLLSIMPRRDVAAPHKQFNVAGHHINNLALCVISSLY